ncbi:Uncharacterized protein Adt_33112 [Abeliophyllum distichum]|uniref:Uncharacterized protein n=1 Tax=Abeliophyllum distichum TaxID=126358 RepID=A0ABD1QXY8_9LAMI
MADEQVRKKIKQEAAKAAAMEAARLAAHQIQQHEEEEDDDDGNMPMAQFLTPAVAPDRSSIVYLAFGQNDFQLRADLINLFSNHLQFYGKANENPNTHISRYLRMSHNFQFQGVDEDAIKLRLFSYTLRDETLEWSIANQKVNKAWDLYELIANTHTMFSSDRTTQRKAAGIHEIDGLSATNAQLAMLTKQVELLVRTQMQ